MNPCLIDSGFLYALIDKGDQHTIPVKITLETVFEEIILPVPAITEVAYFVSKNLGPKALADFIYGLNEMNLIIESPMPADYIRSAEILRKYNETNIDFVDACIVAMAERLNYKNSDRRPSSFQYFQTGALRFV